MVSVPPIIAEADFHEICDLLQNVDRNTLYNDLINSKFQYEDHRLQLSKGLSLSDVKSLAKAAAKDARKRKQVLESAYVLDGEGEYYYDFTPSWIEPLYNQSVATEKAALELIDCLPTIKPGPTKDYAFQALIKSLSSIYKQHTGHTATTTNADDRRPTKFQQFVRFVCVGFGNIEIIDTFEKKVHDAMHDLRECR